MGGELELELEPTLVGTVEPFSGADVITEAFALGEMMALDGVGVALATGIGTLGVGNV